MAQGEKPMDRERRSAHSHNGIQEFERCNWFSYETKQCMDTFWIVPNMFSFRQLRFSAENNAESTVSTIFNVHIAVRADSWQKGQEEENDNKRITFPTSTASRDSSKGSAQNKETNAN